MHSCTRKKHATNIWARFEVYVYLCSWAGMKTPKTTYSTTEQWKKRITRRCTWHLLCNCADVLLSFFSTIVLQECSLLAHFVSTLPPSLYRIPISNYFRRRNFIYNIYTLTEWKMWLSRTQQGAFRWVRNERNKCDFSDNHCENYQYVIITLLLCYDESCFFASQYFSCRTALNSGGEK